MPPTVEEFVHPSQTCSRAWYKNTGMLMIIVLFCISNKSCILFSAWKTLLFADSKCMLFV